MFLHIGSGKSIKKRDIIGFFDLDTSTVSKITRDFISKKEKEGKIWYSDADLPRSFILTGDGDFEGIDLSRISTAGLYMRVSERLKDLEEIDFQRKV